MSWVVFEEENVLVELFNVVDFVVDVLNDVIKFEVVEELLDKIEVVIMFELLIVYE